MQTWELWYPDSGATGLLVARGRLDSTEALWAHAMPPAIAVVVRDADDRIVAQADRLERAGERYPMTRLAIAGERVEREDRWPAGADLGTPVILPGGEVGILLGWWNAADGSEWRWQIELYNHT
jgi:hypothetical protein